MIFCDASCVLVVDGLGWLLSSHPAAPQQDGDRKQEEGMPADRIGPTGILAQGNAVWRMAFTSKRTFSPFL